MLGVLLVNSADKRSLGYASTDVRRRARKRSFWTAVFRISLTVFICCIIALGAIAYSYWQGQNKYDNIATDAFGDVSDIAGLALSDVEIDWDALLAINPDTVGWVYVPGTNVNYPIVHTDNNSTYLKTDFLGERSWIASYGTIFLAAENAADFSDTNNIVYGHHMHDGSMFAAFAEFLDEDQFNANRTIYVFTPSMNYCLTTFAIVIAKATDPIAQINFTDTTELLEYLQDKVDNSQVESDFTATDLAAIEKLFTFSTCTDWASSSSRTVLFGAVTSSAVPVSAGGEAGQGGSIGTDDAQSAQDAATDTASTTTTTSTESE